MIIARKFWINKIQQAWTKKNIVWLSGVRRAGKTSLAKSLDNGKNFEYFDCELNRIRTFIENDIQGFLDSVKSKTVVLDEIHRLENPSELLKVAADHYSNTKILATGSSTLAATKKFKDSLTDRKISIRIKPMISDDLLDFEEAGFGNFADLDRRFLQGGLPPYYMAEEFPESSYQDWVDSYWAKDILELYNLKDKFPFQKFLELVFIQSGGMFEATDFAGPCKVSSPTISNYLSILEETFVANILRPYSKNKNKEIVSAPKVYGFDTGLVSYFKGWLDIRNEDRGIMWEHFVLNELLANSPAKEIGYWRDKKKREIDFTISKRGSDKVHTIETKWLSKNFDVKNLKAFRSLYPEGDNYLVVSDVDTAYNKSFDGLELKVLSLKDLIASLQSS